MSPRGDLDGCRKSSHPEIQSLDHPSHSDFSKLYVTVICYFYSGGALAMSGQPSKCSCRLQVMKKD